MSLLTSAIRPPLCLAPTRMVELKMRLMAKKTGMSSSSLLIVTIVLLALAAWMYFKR